MSSRDRIWRLIGLLLLAFALSRINLGQTALRVVHARPEYLVVAVASTAPLVAVRAWRLQVILAGVGIVLPFRQVLTLRIVTSAAGDATPGRLGEFGAAAYLRRAGYSASKAALAVLIDRGLDGAVFALTAIATVFRISDFGFRISDFSLGVGSLQSIASQSEIRNSKFEIRNWVGAGLLSVVAFFLLVFRAYCLALALDIPISFFALAGVVAISTFVQLLPISVLGIGSRDVSLLYLFHRLGLPASSAIGLSWLVLAMLVLQLLVGAGVWIRYPLRFSNPLSVTSDQDSDEKHSA
ncbi:MAG: lysylphosphatidylglycerol synthase transmembrane domain-containing protein [Anaerolineae bacterium]